MSYLLIALAFLVEVAFSLLSTLIALRLLLPLVRASFHNPLCQAVYRATHALVAPLGRVLRPWGRFDVASAVLLWLAQVLQAVILSLLLSRLSSPWTYAIAGVAGAINLLIWLYLALILIRVVLSFVQADTDQPLLRLVWQLTEPLLRPIRRRLPPARIFDFSTLVASIALVLARILIVLPLYDLSARVAWG